MGPDTLRWVFVMALLQCGVPCPDDVATVTAACMGTGILTIGVLAAVASPALLRLIFAKKMLH